MTSEAVTARGEPFVEAQQVGGRVWLVYIIDGLVKYGDPEGYALLMMGSRASVERKAARKLREYMDLKGRALPGFILTAEDVRRKR